MPATRRPSAAPTGDAPAAEGTAQAGALRVLKKYPNRRLYDTRTSSYITLADVKTMVLGGESFEVRDAKSGEDITRSILLQIILEEESGGVPMFSTETLAQIIRLYGHAMQGMMGTLLERNMRAFAELQSRLLEQSRGLYDPGKLTPEAWTQLMSGQAPMLQEWMTGYFEQSRGLVEQWQRNTGALFTSMPGFGQPAKK
ncbi:MAG: polyhydroxyalkanoate synthesis repressor PhaR [Rubrivivax sp.]|nr:polyhydroxyalkanoate synthesis repressor PhaR [Rubrivivax sp.]